MIKIILTGPPRIGKSTLLKKNIAALKNGVGLITNEIVEDGFRVGFELENHLGQKAPFADTKVYTKTRVGKYFINLPNLEALLPTIQYTPDDIVYIDEIGDMQISSDNFKILVREVLNSENIAILTLSAVSSDPFVEFVRNRKDVYLIRLTEANRDEMSIFIPALIKKAEKAKRYLTEDRVTVISTIATVLADHGNKTLALENGTWICPCSFFDTYKICSHSIATAEAAKTALKEV